MTATSETFSDNHKAPGITLAHRLWVYTCSVPVSSTSDRIRVPGGPGGSPSLYLLFWWVREETAPTFSQHEILRIPPSLGGWRPLSGRRAGHPSGCCGINCLNLTLWISTPTELPMDLFWGWGALMTPVGSPVLSLAVARCSDLSTTLVFVAIRSLQAVPLFTYYLSINRLV